jgi:undecaprenyl diphosphate synthase
MLRHLAVIPDGNRRWAKKQGVNYSTGYKEGVNRVRDLLDWWINTDIKILSIYVLSYENFKNRPSTEIRILLKYLNEFLDDILGNRSEHAQKIHENQVKIRFIGLISKLPKKIVEKMRKVMSMTKNYKNKVLNLLIVYGGRVELLNAVNKAIKHKIPIKNLRKFLWVKEDVDLIIRTGGFRRLSNLLIYQSAYAEIYVLDKLWPEVTKDDFENAVKWFYSIKRNFGR